MLELNLPAPSDKLINYIKEFSLEFPIDEINISRRQKFIECNSNINIALASHPTTDLLKEFILQEYSNFLQLQKNDFEVNCLLMQNLDSVPCFIPPHTDIGRPIAINYTIMSGGSKVETTFYKNYSENREGTTSHYNDSNLLKDKSYELNDNKWYAFNARQYHSVDNIQDKRLVLSISFWKCQFVNFKELYKDLIVREF